MKNLIFSEIVNGIITKGDPTTSDALGAAIVLELPTLPPDIVGETLQPEVRSLVLEFGRELEKPGPFTAHDARLVERLRSFAREMLKDYFQQWELLSREGGSNE